MSGGEEAMEVRVRVLAMPFGLTSAGVLAPRRLRPLAVRVPTPIHTSATPPPPPAPHAHTDQDSWADDGGAGGADAGQVRRYEAQEEGVAPDQGGVAGACRQW